MAIMKDRTRMLNDSLFISLSQFFIVAIFLNLFQIDIQKVPIGSVILE